MPRVPPKPLHLFAMVYDTEFWQRHTLQTNKTHSGVYFDPRPSTAPDTQNKRASVPAPVSPAETKWMHDCLVGYIDFKKADMGPDRLLLAATNVARFNKTVAKAHPVPPALLLDAPHGAQAPAHLVDILTKIEKRDVVTAQKNKSKAPLVAAMLYSEPDPDVVRGNIIHLFDRDLDRLRVKYSHIEPWSQSAVVFAEYAHSRVRQQAAPTPDERQSWRALRSRLQRSLKSAQHDLADFDAIYARAAASMMAFTRIANDAKGGSVHFPLSVPDLIEGGNLELGDASQADFFATIFQEVLGGLEEVRLQFLSPRLAELNEAQTRLGQALRRNYTQPAPKT